MSDGLDARLLIRKLPAQSLVVKWESGKWYMSRHDPDALLHCARCVQIESHRRPTASTGKTGESVWYKMRHDPDAWSAFANSFGTKCDMTPMRSCIYCDVTPAILIAASETGRWRGEKNHHEKHETHDAAASESGSWKIRLCNVKT